MNDNNVNNIGKLSQTASSSSLTAKEIAEKKRDQKKSLIKMVAMGILTLILLIFSSLSWFTMNKQAESNGMNIIAQSELFTISTSSNAGVYDAAHWNDAISASGRTNAVTWQITPDTDNSKGANMRNYDNTTIPAEEQGIKPGTEGKIVFTLIPSQTINAHFDFRLYAFSVDFEDDGVNEKEGTFALQDDTDANRYLNGHLLLFTGRTGEGTTASPYVYSGLITPDADLIRSTPNVVYSSQTDIPIYWVWTETLAQVIFPRGHERLKGKNSINSPELTAYFKANPEYFLDCSSTEATALKNCSDDDLYDLIDENYQYYSKKYNEADQIIGTRVNYILLDMEADAAAK